MKKRKTIPHDSNGNEATIDILTLGKDPSNVIERLCNVFVGTEKEDAENHYDSVQKSMMGDLYDASRFEEGEKQQCIHHLENDPKLRLKLRKAVAVVQVGIRDQREYHGHKFDKMFSLKYPVAVKMESNLNTWECIWFGFRKW